MANEKQLKKIRNLYNEIAGRITDIGKKEKEMSAAQKTLLSDLTAVVAKYQDIDNIKKEDANLAKAALQTGKAVSKNLQRNNMLTRMGLNFQKLRIKFSSKINAEEKQVLLETTNINNRKIKFEKILYTYIISDFNNKTIQ